MWLKEVISVRKEWDFYLTFKLYKADYIVNLKENPDIK